MRRPARLPSVFTRFARLLALRDRFAGRFRSRGTEPQANARLGVEVIEERVMLSGNPLPYPVVFAGSGVGDSGQVVAYNADTGTTRFTTSVFGDSFTAGVRVAAGDFTGDGTPDAVVTAASGTSGRVETLDGTSGDVLTGSLGEFTAYSAVTGGGVVAATGDVEGDGVTDLITAAQTAAGLEVKVFRGTDATVLADFTLTGSAFAGAVSLAAGDFTGSGKADVVVGGAGGWVGVYNPLTGAALSGTLGGFWAFGSGYTGGAVSVAADPLAGAANPGVTSELAVGTGAGPTTEVKVFDATGTVVQDIEPFGTGDTNGASVGLAYVSDAADPTVPDVVVGSGAGTTDRVAVFDGTSGDQLADPLGSYAPFGATADGVFVAAENDPSSPTETAYYNGSTSTTALVAGEPATITVSLTGRTVTPTGTVAFTVSNASSVVLASWTGILTATAPLTATTSPFTVTLGAGTYTLATTYSGDSNYARNVYPPLSFTVSADPSGTPAPVAPSGTAAPDLLATPTGAGVAQVGVSAATGVTYGTGAVTLTRTDLSSVGFGTPWGLDWSWTGAPGYSDGFSGSGSTVGQNAYLTQLNGNTSIALVSGAGAAHFFDLIGSTYVARYGDPSTLVYNTTADEFVATDGTGQTFTFYDFSTSTPTGRAGKLLGATDAYGNVTSVTAWTSAGQVQQIEQTTGTGASQVAVAFVYSYLTSGVNAGLVSAVVQEDQTAGGSWTAIRQVAYTYYGSGSSNGVAGELQLAAVEDGSGNVLDTTYYRYYTSGTGSSGNVEYVFDPQEYALLTAALGTGVDSLTNTQVAPFADQYFQYNTAGQVSSVTQAGAGASTGTGQGTYSYTYTANTAAVGSLDPNTWQTETVETQPDGTTNTVFTNGLGQVMLSVYTDASGNQWLTYNRYDSSGRLILTANPSAVTGYSTGYNDLVDFNGGTSSDLSSSSGLITDWVYATGTTATTTAAGNAAGYLEETEIQQGQTGTAVPQEAYTYIENAAGGIDYFNVASDTKYRNTNGTGGETTSYSYTYQTGTNQIASVTTTLPLVTTAENGSGTANTTQVVYDTFGRPVWSMDASGYIDYTQYDNLTGAVVKTITDVNTADTSTFTNLPSGWATPTGGGLQLTTTYVVDGLGRTTKETDPAGHVTYTVYLDAAHEVRTYAGWNAATNMPTGPTMVARTDMANGYTETLTMSAAPAVSGGVPTGAEAISELQSLTRTYTNDVGQVTATDTYYNLSGLAYTTAVMGTAGVNFDQTQYQYDVDGNLSRTVDQLGTITRTVFDGQGRKLSTWVGTNDTPTSGAWSPTNNTGSSNMVETESFQYDGGGVGDGNLTADTVYPGGSAAAEETEYWYDWRDRKVAQKQGVQGTEASGVNRPLTVWTYDNLGEVTETQTYTADGVAPTISGGVFSLGTVPAANLRAQSATSYDEQGQVYRTDIYDVNPSTGAVGTYTLYTLYWHDARGNVIETQAPGGLVTKDTFDGAGRNTAEYTTDGGGGTGYAAAGSVASDTVLTQTANTFDADGDLTETVTSDRFDTATGTGALGTPTSGISARVYYEGYYYDLADRQIASVNVGTNGGSAWTMPTSVPTGSATVLVTSTSYAADAVQDVALTGGPTGGTFTLTFGGQTTGAIAYNASAATVQTALAALSSVGSGNVSVSTAPGGSGWEVWFTGTLAATYQTALVGNGSGLTGGSSPGVSVSTISAGGDAGYAAQVTDPLGEVTRTDTDAEGRTVRTVQDFTNGVVANTSNATTGYTYNQVGTTSITAYQTGGGGQTTLYVYGVTTGGGSTIDSNDVVGVTEYPNPTTGAPSTSSEETTTVNALNQPLTMTDRDGNVHAYTYDVLGRQTFDSVTTLGTGVDGTVRLIETQYDGQGNPYLVTSYSGPTGGTIVNQTEDLYNGLGQLTADYQSVQYSVNTSSTPAVQYAYTEMSGGADNSRLTSVTYPDGYVLDDNYSSGLNSTISRLSSLSDSTGTLESYKYLGLDTIVERDHPQTDVNQTLISQTGGTGVGGDKYVGLDQFGRVIDDLWTNTSTSTTIDEFQYGYDADGDVLYRQNAVNTSFGELYTYTGENQLATFARGTLNGTDTGITGTASASQSFVTNATGDFTSVTTNGTATTETANAQNEITGVSGATTPTYDANGNMTGDQNGNTFTFDAWNRMVAVKNSSGTTLETNEYDGLNRLVAQTVGGTTTDLYYSSQDQVLEEFVGGAAVNRYVWSPVYVNALVLRDSATGTPGTLNERLWVQQDANWNVTALVNGSGVVVERYVYTPFGVQTVLSAGWGTLTGSAYGWVYLYQGMRYDATSGQYRADERWYSPTLQVWTTVDPTGFRAGDVDLYRFVGNGPTGATDPTGLGPPQMLTPMRTPTAVYDLPGGGSQAANAASPASSPPQVAAGGLVAPSIGTLVGAWLGTSAAEIGAAATLAAPVVLPALFGLAMTGLAIGVSQKTGLDAWIADQITGETAALTAAAKPSTHALAQAAEQIGRLPLGPTGPTDTRDRDEGACFAAGTPVRVPGGCRAIEQLRAGDVVLSRDEYDPAGDVFAKVVEEVFVAEGGVWHVHAGGQVIRTTGEHPFFVPGRGWLPCHALRVGDWLTTQDGLHVRVTDLLDTGESETVYNVRVADFHTYFVGCDEWGFSVWAHNTCYWVIGENMDRVGSFTNRFNAAKNPADSARYLNVTTLNPWTIGMNNSWMGGRIAARALFLSVGRDPGRATPRDPDYFGSEITMLNAAGYTSSYIGNWTIIPGEISPVYKYTPPGSP